MPNRVIVLGGGVAGMSAAHELIERGFEVVVLERGMLAGGKARSIPVGDDSGPSGHEVADTGPGSIEHNLPGEHGFRFFPGFYKHVIDTMRRIPSFDGRTAADHLVSTTRVGFTQYGKPTFVLPAQFPRTGGDVGTLVADALLAFGPVIGLSPEELAFFGARFWQILTSCEARRIGEYEKISWWEFIDAETRSASYQKFLAVGFTRSLVASKARRASARTVGDMFMQMMLTFLDPTGGTTDRVLDGPTNFVWIDPWCSYLQSRGVQYLRQSEVLEILCDDRRVTGVAVRQQGQRTVIEGDYYIAAIPIERMAPMVNKRMRAIDPALANLSLLAPNVEWMNGLQFYLRRDVPIAHGHVIHIDSHWALTSVSQIQFWRSFSPDQFGDSNVRGVLSVDISNWDSPGSDGRTAMECSREEVMREVWSQLKRSLNVEQELLRDEDLLSWYLDPDIQKSGNGSGLLTNAEPLLVNLVDTWALRPEATTRIPNLFLASDYVRTYTDLATMEGANEAARRAVNGLLDATGFVGPRCGVWPLYQPEILLPLQQHDAARYAAGLPWDDRVTRIAVEAVQRASPVLAQVTPLLEHVQPYVSAVVAKLDAQDLPALDLAAIGLPGPGAAGVALPGLPDGAVGRALPELTGGTAGLGQDFAGPTDFLERLGWYRGLLDGTLAGSVPTLEPQRHLYALVRDFLERSGKGLRPAFCIATTRALGGRAEDSLFSAAGIEMLHNAFLVHDDIEDGSEERRGVATMHRRTGLPIAVNTGDAMNALAMRLFRRNVESLGPAASLRILDEVDHMLVECLEGQAVELGWVRDNDLTVRPEDYLRLVLKKTAWYSFIHPMRIGAIVANPDDHKLERFDRFGYLLGAAFQITDDVLNLTGDASRYGKEINGDLLEGKRTMVLAHALGKVNAADRAWIGNFLSRPRERRLAREVLHLRQILARTGSIEWAQQSAAAFAEAAKREFDETAFAGVPAGPDLQWLRGCVDFIVQRNA